MTGPLPRAVAFALITVAASILSGCLTGQQGGSGDGDEPTPTQSDGPERRWSDPWGLDLRFDGEQSYEDVLYQVYSDPDEKRVPRYRIPGSAETALVAEWLRGELEAAVAPGGGVAQIVPFDGNVYYDQLDLRSVGAYACAEDDPRRERVRGIEFRNVVARTDPTELGIVIGAHYDSKLTASQDRSEPREPVLGADDGASGTAVVLGLARALAQAAPDVALTFVLFDGEDGFEDCHPLAGSLHHAQVGIPEAQRDSVEGMILLDMVGNASAEFRQLDNSRNHVTKDGATVKSGWLMDHIWDTAAAMQVTAFRKERTSAVIDDHIPYLEEGIGSVDIIRFSGSFPPYWHTTRDDHTAVSAVGLDQVGAVVEAAVRRFGEAERPA